MSLYTVWRKVLIALAVVLVALAALLSFFFYKDIPLPALIPVYGAAPSAFADIEGMPVHYRLEGQGPPLILLHGTGASLHTWQGWVEALKDHYMILRFDLPGFGLTGPHPEKDYSTEMYMRMIDGLTSRLGIDTFYLAGNSLGGKIAWEYAALNQDKVQKLILIDASGYPNQNPPSLGFRLAQSRILKHIVRYVTPKPLIRKSLLEVYLDSGKVTKPLVEEYHTLLLREGNRQAFIDRMQMGYRSNQWKLGRLKMPVLIMWGKHDRWIPVEHAYAFQQDIPGSIVRLYEAGHVPMEELPQATAEDAMTFLQ